MQENNKRPHSVLFGLTAEQVYDKKIMPDKNYFTPQIKEAVNKRREENLKCNICEENK